MVNDLWLSTRYLGACFSSSSILTENPCLFTIPEIYELFEELIFDGRRSQGRCLCKSKRVVGHKLAYFRNYSWKLLCFTSRGFCFTSNFIFLLLPRWLLSNAIVIVYHIWLYADIYSIFNDPHPNSHITVEKYKKPFAVNPLFFGVVCVDGKVFHITYETKGKKSKNLKLRKQTHFIRKKVRTHSTLLHLENAIFHF